MFEEVKVKCEVVFDCDFKGIGKEFLKGFVWKMVKDLIKKLLK